MNDLFYVKKFIRDDGKVLEFDQNEIYLDEENVLLARPDPNTTAVNYTEANGGEMLHQQNPTFTQEINGLIIPKATPYWRLVFSLTEFFRINHTYKIVYIRKNGQMFAVDDCWIARGMQVPPHPQEEYTRWSITLEIGREAWREYSEDAAGNETFANQVEIPMVSSNQGGEVWDNVGLVSDEIGEVWEAGSGGIQEISIDSTTIVYPVWVVTGPCSYPSLRNNTTNTTAQYNGTIDQGQTLTVNFETGVAYLDTALVTRNVEGIFSCNPGMNVIGFDALNSGIESSLIKWNNTIG